MGLLQKEGLYPRRCSDEFDRRNRDTQTTPGCPNDAMHNISSITQRQTGIVARQQGAQIHAVTNVKEHRVHYGVQSATFIRTVFPGEASGTYRINSSLPTWQNPRINASSVLPGQNKQTPRVSSSGAMPVPYRAAGSPPIPYPPSNASAYYSKPHTRIIPNTNTIFFAR